MFPPEISLQLFSTLLNHFSYEELMASQYWMLVKPLKDPEFFRIMSTKIEQLVTEKRIEELDALLLQETNKENIKLLEIPESKI